jgi:hypothetical protein
VFEGFYINSNSHLITAIRLSSLMHANYIGIAHLILITSSTHLRLSFQSFFHSRNLHFPFSMQIQQTKQSSETIPQGELRGEQEEEESKGE